MQGQQIATASVMLQQPSLPKNGDWGSTDLLTGNCCSLKQWCEKIGSFKNYKLASIPSFISYYAYSLVQVPLKHLGMDVNKRKKHICAGEQIPSRLKKSKLAQVGWFTKTYISSGQEIIFKN